jgi:hypothetical protein
MIHQRQRLALGLEANDDALSVAAEKKMGLPALAF